MNEATTPQTLEVVKLLTNTASKGKIYLTRCGCGRTRKVPESKLSEITCCYECELRMTAAGMGGKALFVGDFASQYINRWREYITQFTAEQRAYFNEIMAGREHSERNLAEAVDVVMREPLAAG
jgi:hypothetical protein